MTAVHSISEIIPPKNSWFVSNIICSYKKKKSDSLVKLWDPASLLCPGWRARRYHRTYNHHEPPNLGLHSDHPPSSDNCNPNTQSQKYTIKQIFIKKMWLFLPEDPVGCTLKQFRRDDVCERCYRRCTISTPIKKRKQKRVDIDQQTEPWVSRTSALTAFM